MDAWLTGALEALAALGPWRYLVAAVGMFCETSLFIGLLVPGDTIVLFTSTANRGVLEWLLLLVSVVVGSLAGESVGFAIGRWFGPRLRRTRLGRRIGERQWERSERWIERRGGFAVFLSRFLPVLHALVPVTVGMSDFAYRRFLAWTAPACVLWALIYVTAGTAAGTSYRALSGELHSAAWIVLGAVVLFLVVIALGKRVLHRFERRSTRHR
ncbi:DedA family protein [Amnibacterium sp. CER49]|uniref:DedA family protein n=1 Tax=Amnibacterium sp. CER49 TaxID=3039161 RepID=UPI00244B78D3|nr:DedA family protein [Amnibacterium sp. CER49]MDH2442463.1 DedA family protein [Amnibacterium sp. CER49]